MKKSRLLSLISYAGAFALYLFLPFRYITRSSGWWGRFNGRYVIGMYSLNYPGTEDIFLFLLTYLMPTFFLLGVIAFIIKQWKVYRIALLGTLTVYALWFVRHLVLFPINEFNYLGVGYWLSCMAVIAAILFETTRINQTR